LGGKLEGPKIITFEVEQPTPTKANRKTKWLKAKGITWAWAKIWVSLVKKEKR